jgi:hypothetical protein
MSMSTLETKLYWLQKLRQIVRIQAAAPPANLLQVSTMAVTRADKEAYIKYRLRVGGSVATTTSDNYLQGTRYAELAIPTPPQPTPPKPRFSESVQVKARAKRALSLPGVIPKRFDSNGDEKSDTKVYSTKYFHSPINVLNRVRGTSTLGKLEGMLPMLKEEMVAKANDLKARPHPNSSRIPKRIIIDSVMSINDSLDRSTRQEYIRQIDERLDKILRKDDIIKNVLKSHSEAIDKVLNLIIYSISE